MDAVQLGISEVIESMTDSKLTAAYAYVTKVKFNKAMIATLVAVYEGLEEGEDLYDLIDESTYLQLLMTYS